MDARRLCFLRYLGGPQGVLVTTAGSRMTFFCTSTTHLSVLDLLRDLLPRLGLHSPKRLVQMKPPKLWIVHVHHLHRAAASCRRNANPDSARMVPAAAHPSEPGCAANSSVHSKVTECTSESQRPLWVSLTVNNPTFQGPDMKYFIAETCLQ